MGFDQLSQATRHFATKLICHKSRQLAANQRVAPSDRDDIEQDLWVYLLENLPRFDAERGNIEAFITTVVNRKAASIARRHKRQCRKGSCVSLSTLVPSEGGAFVELGTTIAEDDCDVRLFQDTRQRQDHLEMAIDIAELIAKLPEDLRELCERLKTHTLTEIARETDVPRSTLVDRLKQIRERFQAVGLENYF
jgi:RNA polymerase sigma-70 factor (ECF subfamily)